MRPISAPVSATSSCSGALHFCSGATLEPIDPALYHETAQKRLRFNQRRGQPPASESARMATRKRNAAAKSGARKTATCKTARKR
jgi:hypothetical protein